MKKLSHRAWLVCLAAGAYAASSVIEDPVGDVPAGAPAYLDVVQGKVTLQEGTETLFFLMEVAEAIPKTPSESFLNWNFPLDTDGNVSTTEWVVVVRAINGEFIGRLVHGPTLAETAIPFSVDGATVKLFVDLAAIGSPSSFSWRADSRIAPRPAPRTDSTPNVTWTR
jgi:hypothetical protein